MAHGSIHWSECMSTDVEAAKAHYGAVCGWSFEGMPMPEGTYWVAMAGGQAVCGLMSVDALPVKAPPHWMTYIAVDDIGTAIDKAKETGGRVEREPFDVPGVGKVAMIAEPGGALCGMIEPASAPPAA